MTVKLIIKFKFYDEYNKSRKMIIIESFCHICYSVRKNVEKTIIRGEKNMKKKYMSEEEVKEVLNISDFRSLSKEKVMEFISIIPKVDKEVAMNIINQFPNYVDMAKNTVGGMINLCNEVLKDNKIGRKDVIESYKFVLETLRERLNNEKLTVEEQNKITDDMIAIAEKIDNANDKHNLLVKDMILKVGSATLSVVVLGIAILGGLNNKDNSK